MKDETENERRGAAGPPVPWVPAALGGVDGEAHPPPVGGAGAGTWQGDLDEGTLVALLRAAAVGERVAYRDARGVQRVVVQRCWYDVAARRVRVRFATVGLPA